MPHDVVRPRRLSPAALLIAAGLAVSAPAAAAAPPLLTPLPGVVDPGSEHEKAVVRQGAVTIQTAALPPGSAAVGAPIAMDLFPDLRVTGEVTSVERTASGADLYRGVIHSRPGGSFALVHPRGDDPVLVGEVRLGLAGLFELRTLPGDAGGAHIVRQIDESLLPPCATGPEHAVVSPPDPEGLRGVDDGSILDVIVMYTPLARDNAGGRTAMEALIDLGVSNTNLSYANSNIPSVVRLVHTGVIDYTETGAAGTELSRFRATSDGFMDGVHCLRDAYAADFAALIVNDFNACGIGYLMSNPSTGFASSAFSVTARGCLSSYTFAHELGHNQGSHHDRDNAGSTPAYSYSYGWRTPGEQFRTVMSYAPGTRIPYFSSPLVTFQGFVLGSPEGQADAADNARSIRNTTPIAAQFRDSRNELRPLERVSISSAGVQANAASGQDRPAISDSGAVVAFTSLADNLGAADANGGTDVYSHNRASGLTACESLVSGAGSPTSAGGLHPSLSGSGRYLVFASDSPSIVSGDSNGVRDVFLRDRQTGAVSRISIGPGNAQADGPSTSPVIARSALVAAFESTAGNLGGGAGGQSNIFVRNISTGATSRISNGMGGASPSGPSARPHLSADGRYIVFESAADNLVPGDLNGVSDIFLHDRQTLLTTRVSISGTGLEAGGPSFAPRISDDGRYIAFDSDAANLVANDTNAARDVFLHDRQTGATRRVSLTATGGQIMGPSTLIDLAAAGRLVAFTTPAPGVVPVDTNTHADLFIRDVAARQTRRLSFGWIAQQFNGPVTSAAVSASGRYAVVATSAINAAPCDGNGTTADIVLIDAGEPAPAPCPGDFNADGVVSSADISAFLTAWLDSLAGATADGEFNGDGVANSTDISAFLTAWLGSIGGC